MNRLYVVMFSLLCYSLLPSCFHHPSQEMKISVEESDLSYTFSASFPEEKTAAVHRAVNKSIAPNGLFASSNDRLDVTTTLQDKTNFAVKAAPGSIHIRVNREGNSPASYARVKDMCAAVKNALKD